MERAFGQIPEWAKLGPVSLKNYDYRAEAHCAVQGEKRGRIHPTITLQSPEFPLWHEYFQHHLGGMPWCMKALCDRKIQEMTVPEQQPQWFDPSFISTPGYRVVAELPNDPVQNERMRQKFAGLLTALASKNVVTKKSTFKRYTKADLEALYRKHEGNDPAEPAENV